MSEIENRLREHHDKLNCRVAAGGLRFKTEAETEQELISAMKDCWEASAELTTLRAENAELREALDGLLPSSLKSTDGYCSIDGHVTIRAACDEIDRARAALAKGENDA